jgi:hypothetical protein
MRGITAVLVFIFALNRGGEVFAQTIPHRASEIIGRGISLPESGSGRVQDVIMDHHGRATHVLIDSDGVLITMPWGEFASATRPETDDRGVRGYYGDDVPADPSSAWHRALEKAINEVPQ